ncbi:MAG TPA: c-type cytochrome [Chryseolinea sp.]|nr:c-type cytochrome [Chryseolinea sp.]
MAESWRLVFSVLILVACMSCAPKNGVDKDINGKVAQEQPLGLANEGKVLYATCKPCHGDSGQGNSHLHAPALANLDSWYLYRQLMNFKNGLRGYLPEDTVGKQMAAIAETLRDSVVLSHLAAYVETLSDVSTPITLIGDIKKGERSYQSICGSCHGPQGKGNKAMHAPRLNGLDDWYLKSQITTFRSSLRGAHPHDKYGAQMVPMATLLKDDQAINDVTAYIRSVQTLAP